MSCGLKSFLNLSACRTSLGVILHGFNIPVPIEFDESELGLIYSLISSTVSKFNIIEMCLSFENLSRMDHVVADVK